MNDEYRRKSERGCLPFIIHHSSFIICLPAMNRLKIGIHLESLGLPLRKALQQASRLGVGGVQVDAVGDLSPTRLSETGRREFRHMLRAYNLELTAVGCPLRRGLDAAEDQQPR